MGSQAFVQDDRFDFNIVSATAAIPEPASWAMLIGGVGVAGGSLRRLRRSGSRRAVPALA